MTDARGVPLGALVTAGQSHESRSFEAVMDTVRIGRRRRPEAVAGDKGYSCPPHPPLVCQTRHPGGDP